MGLLDVLLNMSAAACVLFVVGFILIIAEMFQPGFGLPGGLGIVSLFVGIVLTAKTFMQGLIMTVVLILILGILLSIVLYSATRGRMSKKLILRTATNSEDGFNGTADMKELVGKSGQTVTVLRPSGCADIEGIHLDVVTRGEYIEKSTPVTVIKVEGNRIVVAAEK